MSDNTYHINRTLIQITDIQLFVNGGGKNLF